VSPNEVLISNSSSSAILDRDKTKTDKVYNLKVTENTFSVKPLEGKRCVIPVGPANSRDAILLSVPQSNSVKWLEKQVALICEETRNSAYYRSEDKFQARLDRFNARNKFFYDRDIKKEGITKPRILVQLALEVLEEKYPNCDCWHVSSIYSDYFLHLETGEVINPCRGHGLGMANALTTLVQCTLFELTRLRLLEQEEFISEEIDAIFFNDDASVGFKNESDLEAFASEDKAICDEYQIRLVLRKTHRVTGGFVFCERYYPSQLNTKSSYQFTEFYNTFSCANIVHAKMYYQSMFRKLPFFECREFLRRVISYWGYEFFRDEWKYPATFGGWINPSLYGVRLDLFDNEFTPQSLKAYEACKTTWYRPRIKRRKADKELYQSPIRQLYGNDLTFSEDIADMLGYFDTVGDVRSKALLYKNDGFFQKCLELTSKIRRESYSHFKPYPTLRNLYDEIRDRHPLTDFLPPKDLIVGRRFEHNKNETTLRPPKFLPNTMLSYIKFYNIEKISDSIIPYRRHLLNKGLVIKGLSVEERRRMNISYTMQGREIIPPYFCFFRDVKAEGKLNEYFYDLDAVTSAFSTLTGKQQVPDTSDPTEISVIFEETEDEKRIRELLDSKYNKFFQLLVEKIGYTETKFLNIVNIGNFLQEYIEPLECEGEAEFDQEQNDTETGKGSGQFIRSGSSHESEIQRGTDQYNATDFSQWLENRDVFEEGMSMLFAALACRLEGALELVQMLGHGSHNETDQRTVFTVVDRAILNASGYTVKYSACGIEIAFVEDPEEDLEPMPQNELFDDEGDY